MIDAKDQRFSIGWWKDDQRHGYTKIVSSMKNDMQEEIYGDGLKFKDDHINWDNEFLLW